MKGAFENLMPCCGGCGFAVQLDGKVWLHLGSAGKGARGLGVFPHLDALERSPAERRDTWRRFTCLRFKIWRGEVAACLRRWVAGEQMLPQRKTGGRVPVRLGGREDPAGGPREQDERLGGFRFIQPGYLPWVFPGSLLLSVITSF